jgi:hypothetical protein
VVSADARFVHQEIERGLKAAYHGSRATRTETRTRHRIKAIEAYGTAIVALSLVRLTADELQITHRKLGQLVVLTGDIQV